MYMEEANTYRCCSLDKIYALSNAGSHQREGLLWLQAGEGCPTFLGSEVGMAVLFCIHLGD
jgi:hypothetical protein